MNLGALPGLGAVALAFAASAPPPLAPTPPPAPAPVVSRAPARTVPDAIERARALGAITTSRADEYEAQWHAAFRASKRLGGPRGALLQQALASARGLAARGDLRSGRLAATLAGVNATTVLATSSRPLPAPGGRVQVPGDTAVYSYRPPYGLQVHPLGTIGKLNALAATCRPEARQRGWHCRRNGLRAAADRIVELGVPAGPTLRFEYLFGFGGARPGWVSAMTQATGAQALARTFAITGERRYAASARAAYRALTRPAPRGAAVVGRDGLIAHLAMYSFRPGMRVLNGEEQSLIGLADYARILDDRPAARLARRGARELATHLRGFDTGAWTLYDLGGAEADLNYHRLAARFAQGVCTRALARGFCPAAARFARYTTQAPRLALGAPAHVRVPRRITLALAASKQAAAHLVVRDRTGGVVLDRRLALGRFGTHIAVPLRRGGTYTVALAGTAVNGVRAVRTVTVRATMPPKPKPKPKPTPKATKKKAPAKLRPGRGPSAGHRTRSPAPTSTDS